MAINRAVRRRPAVTTEPQMLESDLHRVEHAADGRTERRAPAAGPRGLRRLRELDRQTLEAFYVDGESLVEMSDRFDSPVGTIKRRLHVARKRLARELQELAPA